MNPTSMLALRIDTERAMKYFWAFAIAALLLCLPDLVLASTEPPQAYQKLDDALSDVVTLFTGPVAIAICTIGMIAAAAALIFGGELSDLMRRFIMVLLAVAIIGAANGIVQSILSDAALI